jgi:putative transposase
VRFAFIQAHARIWHVVTMCRVLEVSKTGYYAWRARPLCERVKDDCVLTDKIREIQRQVKQRYGRPRVHMELRALGFPCGKHRVGRLMRTAGLNAKHRPRFRVTTQSEHSRPVTPNVLDRQFSLARNPQLAQRDRVWAADITYIPTRQGWLYLAIVLDLASRRVVGWALRTRLEQELALSALRMALAHRSIRLGPGLASFRSRYAVRECRLSTAPLRRGIYQQHEPGRGLLGQRRRRELLRDADEGAPGRGHFRNPRASESRAVRVY